MDYSKSGYWSIATQKHLTSLRNDSANLDEIDNLNIAGKSGRFLGAIRGNGKLTNMKKIDKMANSVGITRSELRKIILPAIETSSDKKVELIRNSIGEITGIQEYVFTNSSVIDIAGKVFNHQGPTEVENAIIESLDETRKIPYLESDLKQRISKNGYKEQNIDLAILLQEQFKLIQKVKSVKSTEAIISNEYVWGVNHEKIAKAVAKMDLGKRETLMDVIDKVQNFQGIPTDGFEKIDPELLNIAKKTGMINPTMIVTGRNFQKEFAFSPNMINISEYDDDILDDVKLFLASIRFGQNYTNYSTIEKPCRFLEYLIDRGRIGPHDANKNDFIMLEKKGIIKVVKDKKMGYNGIREGYFLELVREDIAKKVLKILKNPSMNMKIENEINNYGLVNTCGKFISPEETRIELAKSPESMVEAQEYLNKVLRDELL